MYLYSCFQSSFSHLLSLQPVAVLDQGDPVSEIQVEIGEWAVLQAESPQGRPVNLGRQVLEEEPGRDRAGLADGAQVGGGGARAPVAPASRGGVEAIGGWPSGEAGGGGLLLGGLRPGGAPEVLTHLCEGVRAGAGGQGP